MDCIFCKIVAGQIPAIKVFEDDKTLAFMDINPGTDGHLLVIPKTHAENLFSIAEADLLACVTTAKRVAQAMKTLGLEGLNLFQSNGAAAFQSVFHFHLHLLPRRTGDDVRLPWQPKNAERSGIERTAEKIRAQLS